MPEFRKFGSIPRLFRESVITEKIDGTNACVVVEEFQFGFHVGGTDSEGVSHDIPANAVYVMGDPLPDDGLPDKEYLVYAQSRNQLIMPGKKTDNHGFAEWVWANAPLLVRKLGPGYHYGEWWGSSIQRGYGLTHKRFSLFNVSRWDRNDIHDFAEDYGLHQTLDVVPVLYRGVFDQMVIESWLDYLGANGSVAAPGFAKPEGLIIWHKASGALFKYTLGGDGHKGVS